MKTLSLILIVASCIANIGCAQDRELSLELEIPTVRENDELFSFESDSTISIDYKDTDIREILTEVADEFSLNLVIPDNLQGKSSIKLSNITWRQIFEVLLEPLGYTYIENRNIIEIKRISQLTTEPVDTRVFLVNYTPASEVSISLSPLIDRKRGGAINVDTRSNALVITERPSRMNKIQEIIERLDRPTAQVLVEGKLFELNGFSKEELKKSYSPSAYQELLTKFGSHENTRFIANFSLTTLDGSTAQTGMTEEFDATYSRSVDLNNSKGSEDVDSAVSFTVTPEVNSSGFIKLSIDAVIQSVVNENEGVQKVTKRTLASKISIKDGYTTTLGGIGTATSFSNQSSASPDQKQFIIFLTAKTLNPDGFTYSDTLDPRMLLKMNILDHEIPGYFLDKTTRDALEEIRRNRNQDALEVIESEYQNEINASPRAVGDSE